MGKPARFSLSSKLSLSKSSDSVSSKEGVSDSSKDKPSILQSNRSISIIKPHGDTGLNNSPTEGSHMVQVGADLLKDLEIMESNLDENIPWEASDFSSEVKDSVVSKDEADGSNIDSLLSKIDNQLKKFSEKNLQFELRETEMKNHEDEKLLLD